MWQTWVLSDVKQITEGGSCLLAPRRVFLHLLGDCPPVSGEVCILAYGMWVLNRVARRKTDDLIGYRELPWKSNQLTYEVPVFSTLISSIWWNIAHPFLSILCLLLACLNFCSLLYMNNGRALALKFLIYARRSLRGFLSSRPETTAGWVIVFLATEPPETNWWGMCIYWEELASLCRVEKGEGRSAGPTVLPPNNDIITD